MIEDLKKVPNRVSLEQFDISIFSKDKIRDLFKAGKLPTAEVMVEEILLRSIKEGATEIHLEPTDSELRIRLGFDGVLKKLVSLQRDITENLVSVLKNRANLNTFEKKKPQDGRFTATVASYQFDIRISTLPSMIGERITMRVQHKSSFLRSIDDIGFSEENTNNFIRLLRRPSGLIIVSGSAGSGKTSTLYTALGLIQSPEKNIFTIENPIETKLNYATQIQLSLDKGATITELIRAIMRQNPHVIMIGEIGDSETADIATEAALSGNLVLGTMLGISSVGTIYRLLEMGVSAYRLAATVSGIMHQTLARKICSECKEEYPASKSELEQLQLGEWGQSMFWRGKGCEQCRETGYFGRTGIHEILTITDRNRELLYDQSSISKLKEPEFAPGFVDLRRDAIQKVQKGITSVDEFVRVIG